MTFTAGQKLRASQLNNELGAAVQHDPLDSGTTTSTGYIQTLTGGTSPVGVAFVAPTSGKVYIHWGAGMFNSGAGSTFCAPEIRQGATIGSGTIFAGASDNVAIAHAGTAEEKTGRTRLITGLTAGNTYNVVLCYRVSSGTGTIRSKDVSAQPTT